MVSVSIIIPTYNRASNLADTIKSIQKLEGVNDDVEILVIDNASTDETPDIIESLQSTSKYPLRYIREAQAGLHRCRHAGAKEARGDILIYVDDDVLPTTTWLASYLDAYLDQELQAAGGPVLPHWEADPPVWIEKIPKDYLSLLDYGDQARPIEKNEGINGCNYSVRREALFNVGGFNPDSFADPKLQWLRGDGEAGLTKKLLAAGEKVMYIPGASLWHNIAPERLKKEAFINRSFKHGIENAYVFARRWRCALWSIAALIIGGTTLKSWHSICARITPGDRTRCVISQIQSSRFVAVAAYGWRLLRSPQLRAHVLKETYMDE